LMALCSLMLGTSLCALCLIHSRHICEELSPSSVVIGAIGLALIFGATDAGAVVKTRTALLSDAGMDVTYSEMRAVEKTIASVRKAESSKWGFMVTRDERFLGSYMLAMATLRSTGQNDLVNIPQWQEHDLPALIAARVGQLDAMIELERHGRHKDAIQLVKNASSQALTEQIETQAKLVIDGLEYEALGRKASHQALMNNLMNLVLVSYLINIVLVAVTVLLARFEARQHEKCSMKTRERDLQEPAVTLETEQRPSTDETQRHILLIEDSEDVMLLVGHVLEKHAPAKYRLTWADCLKNGFRELTKGAVDLVLLDLGLPETSGPISFACVRGCAPQTPVLVMTADDSPQSLNSIAAAGADGYLLKQQLSGLELVKAIDATLKNPERPPQLNLRSSRSISQC
jgi:CheY-like chemotaxis protein